MDSTWKGLKTRINTSETTHRSITE